MPALVAAPKWAGRAAGLLDGLARCGYARRHGARNSANDCGVLAPARDVA